ncbi:unnamed protein product [Psylliodes chrysocephalus]|uniref:Uncharacterized protein n=1 Tax=Psylliodes chrysocephalus TaxID=3402493 RepID=A0A9P0D8F7_9CUCU|nr:unnamed protein product [Psylliodes chrysocephala]
MTGHHTSKNLANEISNIAREWEITDKILLIVSDNASNIKGAIMNELNLKHFGCFAHTLNLIVNHSLDIPEILSLLAKVRKVVAHFKRSALANEHIMKYQENMGNAPLKVLQDVATRWNSTYYMLERFLLLENALKSTIAILNKDIPILSGEEWKYVSI